MNDHNDEFTELSHAIEFLRGEIYRALYVEQLARWLNDKLTTITRWLQ